MRFTNILLAVFLLLPKVTFAAWGSGTGVAGTTEEVSDNSISANIQITVNAGEVVALWAATDNVDTTDGQTSLHQSVADSDLNSYTKWCEFTNSQGAAEAGATISLWTAISAGTLTAAVDSITLTTASNVTDKVINVMSFTIGAGNVVSLAGTCKTLANDGADAGSLTISGLSSAERLYIRGIATESNNATSLTASTNFTLMKESAVPDGCANTTGGGEASDMGVCGEYRVNTSTGETSDPTLVDTSNDNASIFIALIESAPPEPPSCAAGQSIALLGVGCR